MNEEFLGPSWYWTPTCVRIPKYTEKGHLPSMQDISAAERDCQSLFGTSQCVILRSHQLEVTGLLTS